MRLLTNTLFALACTSAAASAQVTVLDSATNPANGHTYYLLSESNRTDAEAAAVSLGGHLVTVNDAAEDAWIFSTFGNWGGSPRDLWLGLNDVVIEGTFVWEIAQPVNYTNWAFGQPDNHTGNDPNGEQYVHMYGAGSQYGPGQWNDIFDAAPGQASWSPGLYGVAEVENTTTFQVTGSCPGPITLEVTGQTPGGSIAIVSGTSFGSFLIPGGGCAGLELAFGTPSLRVVVTADVNGDVTLPVNAPAGVCGLMLQAVDLTGCSATNVVAL